MTEETGDEETVSDVWACASPDQIGWKTGSRLKIYVLCVCVRKGQKMITIPYHAICFI